MNPFVQAMTWLASKGQLQTDILKVLSVFCGAGLFFFGVFFLQLFLIYRIERRRLPCPSPIAIHFEASEAFENGTGQ